MPQMNAPPVSPRHCHRTSVASNALGGGRDPGDESAWPLCSRHFQRTDTTAPVSGRSEVDKQAPRKGWAVSPPGLLGAGTGALPWTRAADGAKSLRGVRYVLPAARTSSSSVSTRVRTSSSKYGHGREQARDTVQLSETWRLLPRGSSGRRSWGAEPIPRRRAGRPIRGEPPPHCSQVPRLVLASCLHRACNMRAAEERQQGRPPPHTPPPLRVGEEGRGGRNACPLRTKR